MERQNYVEPRTTDVTSSVSCVGRARASEFLKLDEQVAAPRENIISSVIIHRDPRDEVTCAC